jgi:hypothetical protein
MFIPGKIWRTAHRLEFAKSHMRDGQSPEERVAGWPGMHATGNRSTTTMMRSQMGLVNREEEKRRRVPVAQTKGSSVAVYPQLPPLYRSLVSPRVPSHQFSYVPAINNGRDTWVDFLYR